MSWEEDIYSTVIEKKEKKKRMTPAAWFWVGAISMWFVVFLESKTRSHRSKDRTGVS